MTAMPSFKTPYPHDPWLNLATVRCSECRRIIGYANQKTPTRTTKLVCSMGCGSDAFGTKYVRAAENPT